MKTLKKMILSTLVAATIVSAMPMMVEAQAIREETLSLNEERANDPALTPEAISENDGFEMDEDGNIISITIGGETTEVTKESPTSDQAPVNNQPNRISINVAEDPSTSMYFQWHTTDKDEDARLYVWEEGQSIDDAIEFTPEISEIEDAFYVQETEDGAYVYAIMWDEEEDEPITDIDDNPFISVDQADEVLGYFTDADFTGDNLLWLDKGYEEYSIATPYAKFTETAYKAIADDLTPATVYYYAVGNKDGELSEEGTFMTAAETAEDFTFVHYTDTQNAFASKNQRSEFDYSKSTMDSILANPEAKDAKFAVVTGDVVNDDFNDTEWTLTLEAIGEAIKAMPHLFATGNHDAYNFIQHLHTPNAIEGMESGVAYSTRYNGVQIITLNSEQENDSEEDNPPMFLEDQMDWLKEELEAANKAKEAGEINWVILNYHKPLISASYHSLKDSEVLAIRDELMAVIDEYDVDAVLNGHDHNLTVTHALAHSEDNFVYTEVATEGETEGDQTTFTQPEGTVFFLPDTAGTKNYDAIYKNQSYEWIQENEKIHKSFKEVLDYDVTEDDIKAYRELFVTEDQPFRSPFYTIGHSNAREGNIQHYAVVDVTENSLTYSVYQVIGEDLENRETNLVHTYVIEK